MKDDEADAHTHCDAIALATSTATINSALSNKSSWVSQTDF